jgi:hypothetical protein
MAVVLLTPKPLAVALDFNTYIVQIAGFLVTGFVVASREPAPLLTLEPITRALGQLAPRVIGAILCAGGLEAAQGLVHRSARWFDFWVNAGAVIVGSAIGAARLGLRRYRAIDDAPLFPREKSRASPEPIAATRRRFFIVSTGRSGSTLLAAVLADAGAEFGLPVPTRWDRRTGDMEHQRLTTAAHLLMKAHRIAREKPHGLRRWRWTLLRSLAKRKLRSTLRRVDFVKVDGAHELVRPAFKLGYFPSVIISYRRFEDYAVSLGLTHANATIASLEQNYRSTLRSGLWLLNTFGGCVVSYEQLVDPAERSWAEPLASVTGIPAGRLIAARDARIEAPSARVVAADTERHAEAAFDAVDRLKHKWLPPSAQALRSWQGHPAAPNPS